MNEQRSCGCPWDYHMADCPILTETSNDPPDEDDYYERFYKEDVEEDEEEEQWTNREGMPEFNGAFNE